MKKIILITMLMSAVFAQSDCNESNWEDYYNSDGKYMSDCDLRGADLTGADLTGAKLRDADLEGAKLTGAKLTGADLSDANLGRSNLRGADLTSAWLFGALLPDADLTGADLRSAMLEGARFGDAGLGGAILEGVISGGHFYNGHPFELPDGWSFVMDEYGDGILIEDGASFCMNAGMWCEIYNTINEGKPIKRSKWKAWKKENKPQVSKGKTTFRTIDKNNDGKIGTGEFFKFYQRWIQD